MAQTQTDLNSQAFFDTSIPGHLIVGSQDEILDHTHRIIHEMGQYGIPYGTSVVHQVSKNETQYKSWQEREELKMKGTK